MAVNLDANIIGSSSISLQNLSRSQSNIGATNFASMLKDPIATKAPVNPASNTTEKDQTHDENNTQESSRKLLDTDLLDVTTEELSTTAHIISPTQIIPSTNIDDFANSEDKGHEAALSTTLEELNEIDAIATVIPTAAQEAPLSMVASIDIDNLLPQAKTTIVAADVSEKSPELNAQSSAEIELGMARARTAKPSIDSPIRNSEISQADKDSALASHTKIIGQDARSAPASQNRISDEHSSIIKSIEVATSSSSIAQDTTNHSNNGMDFSQDSSGNDMLAELDFKNAALPLSLDESSFAQITKGPTLAVASSISDLLSNVEDKSISKQVADALSDPSNRITNDKRVVTITLTPDIGNVQVKFEIGAGNQLKILFIAENQRTLDIIVDAKAELIDSLKQVTGSQDTSLSFNLKEGNHGNSSYSQPQEKAALLELENTRSTTYQTSQKNSSYNTAPSYNNSSGVYMLL